MSKIPDNYLDLTTRKTFADFVTLMPDGSPQVSPLWWDYDGEYVIVNTAVGRLKDKNVRRDNRVALSVIDPDNPYRYLLMRGRVVEITTEGADAVIDRLARKYMGVDVFPYHTDAETRVTYKVALDHVTASG
ncbi:MAG: PPOX class F420-dependent oxidoreductase [Caldilineales bacterium]|nr:PPOX class F420-dependent oxidoreductase [Caldilineales bacterium]